MAKKTFEPRQLEPFTAGFVRSLATSAADLSAVVRRETDRVLTQNRNNILRSLDVGFRHLADNGWISPAELKELTVVSRRLLASIRGKEDGEDVYFAIRKVYDRMLLDNDASPAALAIVGAASSAFDFVPSNSVNITPGTAGAGAIVGAVLGGAIGGAIGGPLGAGIGAAIGAAAGAAAGLCNDKGV